MSAGQRQRPASCDTMAQGSMREVVLVAGTPKRRAELEKLKVGLDEFCDLLAEGLSDREACRRFGINGGVLYKLMQEDSGAAARLAHARKAGAAAMASETLDIADELAEQPLVDPVKAAAHRIATRQWLAARRNREEYGDAKGVAVQVKVHGLPPTALRDPPQVIEAQVIEPEPLPAPSDGEPASLNDLL